MPVKRKKEVVVAASPVFQFTRHDAMCACEGLDDFLHATYDAPKENGDGCAVCQHPLTASDAKYRYSSPTLRVHAQCVVWGCHSWYPTVASITGLLAKFQSKKCAECQRSTPNVTCVGCRKDYHLTCAIRAKLRLRWDSETRFDVLCATCPVPPHKKHVKKWITVTHQPDDGDADDVKQSSPAAQDVKQPMAPLLADKPLDDKQPLDVLSTAASESDISVAESETELDDAMYRSKDWVDVVTLPDEPLSSDDDDDSNKVGTLPQQLNESELVEGAEEEEEDRGGKKRRKLEYRVLDLASPPPRQSSRLHPSGVVTRTVQRL